MFSLVAVLGVVMSAGLVMSAPSPKGLKGDFTILINNDLQGRLKFACQPLEGKKLMVNLS